METVFKNEKYSLQEQLNVKHWMVEVLLSYCIFESYLGLSQLLGYRVSNNSVYNMTASFNNPGPFGGFLAVCISIFIPYIVDFKSFPDKRIFLKVLYWLAIIGTALSCFILPLTQSRTAMLSLCCSMLLFSCRDKRLRNGIIKALKGYGICILVSIAIIGIGTYRFKEASADGRFFMDRICIETICSNGWKGTGLGYFGGAYADAQYRYFRDQMRANGNDDLAWNEIDENDRLTADCPDNAFNEYLFVGVEAGPFAMLLLICVIVVSIAVSFKRGIIWCCGLTAFAVFALFSYPLHVWQFQILFPTLIIACLLSADWTDRKEFIVSITTLTLFLCGLTWLLFAKVPDMKQHKIAEKEWKKAEHWHQMEYYEYVVEDCEPLFPYMQNDRRYLFAYGQSLNKTGQYQKSDSILKLGTEISSDPMFWNVMGNNSLALGRYREAEERYKHAFYMVPNRLYPLTLLARLYHTEGDTVRFLKMADMVETFVPKIENANTERLRAEIRALRDTYNKE